MKRIRCLGGLAVFEGQQPLGGNTQQPRRLAILAVLARAGDRGVNRDRLASLLWGDIEEERARRNLNQALYTLRRDLGSDEAIQGTRDLRLNPELVEADVTAFEAAQSSGALEEAARLYGGPFLGDFHLPGVPAFAHWAEEERDRLAADHRAVLEALGAAATRRGDWGAAVLWWRRLAGLDPADAQAAQGLMRALAAAGDAPGALRHAEIFATVRRQELELPPDPEVEALAERIRRGELAAEAAVDRAAPAATPAPAPDAHGQPAIAPPGRPSLSRELAAIRDELRRFNTSRTSTAARSWGRWVAGALALLAVIALAREAVRWRANLRPALRPSVIAIAPFEVLDPGLGLWREGLMDLLSRNLDGAGPLTTIPPTVVLRRWSGRADRESAAELGRATGAALALYGSVLSSGPDSALLRATLLDVASGKTVNEWEVANATDHMDRLVDSLTIRLLEGLGRARPIGTLGMTWLGRTSLPVLKAFLQGEQYHRRSEWDSALAWYQRAIDLDSSFAPALYRASQDLGWSKQHMLAIQYGLRAGVHNRGLPPHDSLLITADSIFFSLMKGGLEQPDTGWTPRARRLLATLHFATVLYPDDPESWHQLGEALTHFGFPAGGTYRQQLHAFDQSIALDSANTPSYIHPIQYAAASGADAMRRYLRPFLAYAPPGVQGEGSEGARLVQRLLESAQGGAGDTAFLRGVSDNGLFDAWESLSRLPDSTELAVRVARFIGSRAWSPTDSHFVAFSLVSRGHLREARGLLGGHAPRRRFLDYGGFAVAALLGAVPAERAAAVFQVELSGPVSPWLIAAFPWWASRGDTASLRRAEAHADSLGRRDPDATGRFNARYAAASAAAYRALAGADTSLALERFLGLPDGACPACFLDRFTLAELLVERHRDREAWQLLQGEQPGAFVAPFATEVLWVLLRARVAERLRERDRARRSYAWVVGMWRNADPELQPYVREARAGLSRLTAEKP